MTGTLSPYEWNFLICKVTLPFLNHKILELEEYYRSLSPTPLVSPVMFTSSLLENHFKIKINVPFTCNIIIKVPLGSHTRQWSGLHLLKTAFNLGILLEQDHTQLKEEKSTISIYTCNSSKYFFKTLTFLK